MAQTKVPFMFSKKVTYVASGHSHTCIMHYRRFYCFGSNNFGQTDIPSPIKNNWLFNPYTTIEAGLNFSCAIFSLFMRLFCWGDQKNKIDYSPTEFAKNMQEVKAKGSHVCGLRRKMSYPYEPSRVGCWGLNSYGQAAVPEVLDGVPVLALSAGVYHSCVVTEGAVVCWGLNNFGQNDIPLILATSFSELKIVAGFHSSCIVKLWVMHCWGEQIGKGAKKAKNRPIDFEREVGVERLDLGFHHACVLDIVGDLVCWGSNEEGQCDLSKIK